MQLSQKLNFSHFVTPILNGFFAFCVLFSCFFAKLLCVLYDVFVILVIMCDCMVYVFVLQLTKLKWSLVNTTITFVYLYT